MSLHEAARRLRDDRRESPRARLVLNAQAWDLLASYYEDRMGKAAADFMDAHFIRAEPFARDVPLTSS